MFLQLFTDRLKAEVVVILETGALTIKNKNRDLQSELVREEEKL